MSTTASEMASSGRGASMQPASVMDQMLANATTLRIQQQVDIIEALVGYEQANKYVITDGNMQVIMYAIEESGCFMRQCCGKRRGFAMRLIRLDGAEVLTVNRPLKCTGGPACISCCRDEVTVASVDGHHCGTVLQMPSMCSAKYMIKDAQDNHVLTIQGPSCMMCACGNVKFDILTPDESQKVGNLYKESAGLVKEMLTNADNFRCEFPIDLDIKIKATLIGAIFLIDFMYFEESNDNKLV